MSQMPTTTEGNLPPAVQAQPKPGPLRYIAAWTMVAFGAAFVSATGVVAGLAGAFVDADGVAGVAGAAAVAGLAGVAGAAAAGLFAGADGAVVVCATALPATNRPAISIVTILLMVFVLSLDDTDDLC